MSPRQQTADAANMYHIPAGNVVLDEVDDCFHDLQQQQITLSDVNRVRREELRKSHLHSVTHTGFTAARINHNCLQGLTFRSDIICYFYSYFLFTDLLFFCVEEIKFAIHQLVNVHYAFLCLKVLHQMCFVTYSGCLVGHHWHSCEMVKMLDL